MGREQEYVVIHVWGERNKFALINYYNTCKKLEWNKLEGIEG